MINTIKTIKTLTFVFVTMLISIGFAGTFEAINLTQKTFSDADPLGVNAITTITGKVAKIEGDINTMSNKLEGVVSANEITTALGYSTINNGIDVTSENQNITLQDMTYYNIKEGSVTYTLTIPSNTVIRCLIHLNDIVSSSNISFKTQDKTTLVTNAATQAITGGNSLGGNQVGLSQGWKMITIRRFKNSKGVTITYLEI